MTPSTEVQHPAYRVEYEEDDRVVVAVECQGWTRWGRVFGLSYDGLGASLQRKDETPLVLDERVTLRLTAPWLVDPIQLSARIRSVGTGPETSRYRFDFEHPQEPEGQLEARLHAMFHRRAAVRVPPAADQPVEVTLSQAEPEMGIIGRLENISATGLAVRIHPGQNDASLRRSQLLEATFQLPLGRQRVAMAAQVRWDRVESESLLYGLVFDPHLSEGFQRRQDEIMGYVIRRKREMLGQ